MSTIPWSPSLRRALRLVVGALVWIACAPVPAPGGATARPLAGGCVLHADAWASDNIHRNVKVFTAVRDNANHPEVANFGGFRLISPPFGSTAVASANADALPNVYALTEAWFRGSGFNEAFRAEVVPSRRDPTDPGTGAVWDFAGQDFTGTWRVPVGSVNFTAANQYVYELDQANDDQLPQWMPVGVATPEMFACAGAPTQNGGPGTTWLMGVMPSGTTGTVATAGAIQDVLNGDDYFTPVASPLGGTTVGPPAPGISGPAGGYVRQGIVSCAMTQTGDDVTSRALHIVSINNRQLLYATLSSFGSVTQPLSTGATGTFNRFRVASPWVEVLQSFPTDFGQLVHVAALATGTDQLLHVFFVGQVNQGGQTVYRLWHTKRSGTGNWSTPVDVLSNSGETSIGTVYDMPISAAFCPAFGDNLGTQPGAEILLAWHEPETNTILVIQVERTPKVWVTGRAASIYSNWMQIPQTGMTTTTTTGQTLNFSTFRVRISSRPFSDM